MTIKQQGGIFGRNPTFNDVEANTLGINTTPSYALDVNSGANDTVARLLSTDNGASLLIEDASGYAQVEYLNGKMNIYADQGDTGSNTRIRFYIDTAEVGRWDENANLQISSGNLIVASGQGIDFSATSGTGTSELFDDYEEGNWTPTYTTDGTDFDNVNYDSRTHGRYVKIGSLVYVSATLQTDGITVGSASGDVLIGGLPYTSSNDPSNAATYAGAVISSAFAGDMPSEASVDRNATTIRLNYRATSNGASVNLQVSDMATSANDNYVQLSFAYRV